MAAPCVLACACVIVRETNEVAWAAADALIEHVDEATIARRATRRWIQARVRLRCTTAGATSWKSAQSVGAGVGLVRRRRQLRRATCTPWRRG